MSRYEVRIVVRQEWTFAVEAGGVQPAQDQATQLMQEAAGMPQASVMTVEVNEGVR